MNNIDTIILKIIHFCLIECRNLSLKNDCSSIEILTELCHDFPDYFFIDDFQKRLNYCDMIINRILNCKKTEIIELQFFPVLKHFANELYLIKLKCNL